MKVLLLLIFPVLARASDFIESVHTQGAEIAKEMVVDGNQVVWSPFSVVNVLAVINGDNSLQEGFQTAINYFKTSEGIEVARLSTGYLQEKESKSKLSVDYSVEALDYPANNSVQEAIEAKYREEIGLDVPQGFIPESLENVTQLYLTSLLIKAEWESPFRYSAKGRFFLNETHAVKARYMKNVGFYKYGELEGVDAKILALPFKNSSTTYLLIVLPNNSSGLSTVSQEFGKAQIGGIIKKLKTRRTQLTLPKISVDSQLVLQPNPTVKILQSGSFRLTYSGVDHRASKLRRSSIKIHRTRTNKEDLKFNVDHPFLFTIFDTQAGVLSYGEVLIPSDQTLPKFSLKSEPNQVVKLSQNAKSLSEVNDNLGNQLYQMLKNKGENIALSPLTLANLLASYSIDASPETQQLIFSNLNSKSGILELNNNVHYFNSSMSHNVTKIYGGSDAFKEKANILGTDVVPSDPAGETRGYYEYTFGINLVSSKSYVRKFYLNERDSVNVRYHEFVGRIKYLTLPFWDAKVLQLYLSPTQSLLLFVPNERSGLHLIETGLQDATVSKLLCQMRDRFVKLRIPAFKITYEADILQDLKSIYNVDELNFGGVGDLKLTNVTTNVTIAIGARDGPHKAKMFQNHRRTPSTRLLIDRPFVYYILDNVVGGLAVGRIVKLENIESPSVSPPSEIDDIKTAVDPTPGNITESTTVNITEPASAPSAL